MRRFALLVFMIPIGVAAARADVPLTWSSTGHVMVPAVINGAGPYLFMLDTGADGSAVYAWFASEHALPKGRSSELGGATGNQAETTTLLSSLSVDGHTIRHVQADTIPDRNDGVKLAGIVGVDLMGHYLTVLDVGCGTAQFLPLRTNSAKVAGKGAVFLRAGRVNSGTQLTFPVSINGAQGVGILDTGAKSTIVNSVFARAAGVEVGSASFVAGEPARGATQQAVASRTGPIGKVMFAGIARDNVTARVVDLPVFEDMGLADRSTVNVGMDLLKNLKLTIDYRHHRIGFAPSACPR